MTTGPDSSITTTPPHHPPGRYPSPSPYTPRPIPHEIHTTHRLSTVGFGTPHPRAPTLASRRILHFYLSSTRPSVSVPSFKRPNDRPTGRSDTHPRARAPPSRPVPSRPARAPIVRSVRSSDGSIDASRLETHPASSAHDRPRPTATDRSRVGWDWCVCARCRRRARERDDEDSTTRTRRREREREREEGRKRDPSRVSPFIVSIGLRATRTRHTSIHPSSDPRERERRVDWKSVDEKERNGGRSNERPNREERRGTES